MDSTQQSNEPTDEGGTSDVASTTAALLTVVRGQSDAGLTGLDIRIKGDAQQPGTAECQVDIHGDTAEDAYTIAEKFEEIGWTCVSSGPTDVTCTSPE